MKMLNQNSGNKEYLDVEKSEKQISALLNMIENENTEIFELL